MFSKISHSINKRKNPRDIFYTPQSLVIIHLKLVKPYIKEGVLLDAFRGNGAYYNMFPTFFPHSTFDWCEIQQGRNFFDYSHSIHAIISNPPYSMIDKVLAHSIQLQPDIISYLLGYGNLTTRRLEIMNNAGYELVSFHLTKVFLWYGMSAILTFRKSSNPHNVISFDRIIHKN